MPFGAALDLIRPTILSIPLSVSQTLTFNAEIVIFFQTSIIIIIIIIIITMKIIITITIIIAITITIKTTTVIIILVLVQIRRIFTT